MAKTPTAKYRTTYHFCKTQADLFSFISKHIYNAVKHPQLKDCKLYEPAAHESIGQIDFRVEGCPSEAQWNDMKLSERIKAWDNAEGCYGIKEVGGKGFDYMSLFMLVGAYYGGSTLCASPTFDMDVTEGYLDDMVSEMVSNLLECEECRNNFIVRITRMV